MVAAQTSSLTRYIGIYHHVPLPRWKAVISPTESRKMPADRGCQFNTVTALRG